MKIEFDDELPLFIALMFLALGVCIVLLAGCEEMNRHNEKMEEINAAKKQ